MSPSARSSVIAANAAASALASRTSWTETDSDSARAAAPVDFNPVEFGGFLLEQFQPRAHQIRIEFGQSRDIAAWPRNAGHEPACHRIGNISEDNGDCRCRLL